MDVTRTLGWLVGAGLTGAALGVVSGVGGRSLFLMGLWPLAAALAGGFALVTFAHLTRERRRLWHLVAAGLLALAWLAADRGSDAVLFHLEQTSEVGRRGLLLADHAVVHDDDDPAALVDASLLAETGAAGWLGAARVQLRVGVPALRVLSVSRVFKVPVWAHALWLALRAALVALVASRALEQLRAEPVCDRCGRSLRRRRLGWLSEDAAREVAETWQKGPSPTQPAAMGDPVRALPELAAQRDARWPVAVLEDRCPAGHTHVAGLELQRARGRGLARRSPGPLARRAAVSSPGEAAATQLGG